MYRSTILVVAAAVVSGRDFDGGGLVLDECEREPCGFDQQCEDLGPKSKDFVCTCTEYPGIKNVGAPASCTFDECSSNPCGSRQTCTEGSKMSRGDFVCTCKSDPVMKKTGARVENCDHDECTSSPCGGQHCYDPVPSPRALRDYICSCLTGGRKITQRAGPAVCNYDECSLPNVCGDGSQGPQICEENCKSDIAPCIGDYKCRCRDENRIAVGRPANCVGVDECKKKPCGKHQVCYDSNRFQEDDFECWCLAKEEVRAVGEEVDCELNECTLPGTCLGGHRCDDPCTDKYDTACQGDYICHCLSNGNSVTGYHGDEACVFDECSEHPCGVQVCEEGSFTKRYDYTCSCTADNGEVVTVPALSKPAVCIVDECDKAERCGEEQTCRDPCTAPSCKDDWICSCGSHGPEEVGRKVMQCTLDECSLNRCGTGQTCTDPNQHPDSQGDYICACENEPSITEEGAKATCVRNECGLNVCGSLYAFACHDPNVSPLSLGDARCSCLDGSNTWLPDQEEAPRCQYDECSESWSCYDSDECVDPNPWSDNLGDFICSCRHYSALNATGRGIGCNECRGNPCGVAVRCHDPCESCFGDYVCSCPDHPETSAVGAPVLCTVDECANNPCGSGQKCKDHKKSPFSLNDYECSCAYHRGIVNVGAPAVGCDHDECTKEVVLCGPQQTCYDPNPVRGRKGDWRCVCDGTPEKSATRRPAQCPEAPQSWCSVSPCGEGQLCADISSAYGYLCICASDTSQRALNAPAICVVDECLAATCGAGQSCKDANQSAASLGDYVCSCGGSESVGAPAHCPLVDECEAKPCGPGQRCVDMALDTRGDYVCWCTRPTHLGSVVVLHAVGASAPCRVDECEADPCPSAHTCFDPNQIILGDYTCTPNGPDECQQHPYPCGDSASQKCIDLSPHAAPAKDFACWCTGRPNTLVPGRPATC